MRKFNSKKIVSLFLALMMLVGIMSISAFAAETEEQTESVSFVSKNIAFGEKVHLMFAVPAAEIEGKEVVTTVKLGDETSTVSKGKNEIIDKADNKVECAVFTADLGVAAQDIDAIYTVTIEVNGEVVADFTYSVLEYLYERKFVSNNVREDQYVMYDAFLAYAGALDTTLAVDNKTFGENFVAVNEKYVYVNTVDCTFDGGKTAGIVEKGAAVAFASNLIADDYHDLVYTIATIGSDEAVTKTADEMASYAFDANATVTASLVENGNTPVIPDEPDPEPDVEPILTTTTYTFANYAAGTQYATNEEHKLDDNVTLISDNGHFTSELRLYSSDTNNSTAVIKSVLPISEITMNIGNKADTLAIYGSNDNGETWEEIGSVTTEGTSYVDKTVAFEDAYTWIKLDVAGTNQMRIKSITLTTASTCAHENVSTKTIAPTCVETGYIVTACNDCGYVVSKAADAAATGHTQIEEIITAATCTVPGSKKLTCSVCGDVQTAMIDSIGHTTDEGVCDNCGQTIGGSDAPAEPVVIIEITKDDFNSNSYADNNNTKTENGYIYTSYQVMNQNSTMQWQKNKGYITTSASGIVKIEMKVTAGRFTVTVGGKTVTPATASGLSVYDLTGLSGEIKISVGNATGKVDYIKFYK